MTALFDLLLQTMRSLRAHALRFSLTSLGIFWVDWIEIFSCLE